MIPHRWQDLDPGDSLIQRDPVMKVQGWLEREPPEVRQRYHLEPHRGTRGQAWTLVTRAADAEQARH